MTYGNLIRAARKSRNWTLQQMADELHKLGVDIDTGNLSRIETSKQGASNEVLDAILRVFGISINSLLNQVALPQDESNTSSGHEIKGRCPVISWVQAGEWTEIMDTQQAKFAEEWMPCPIAHSPQTFVLKVVGESMFDPAGPKSFREGDYIFVDPERPANNGSLVVVRLEDEQEATFKQLVIEGGKQYLKALNPSWPSRIIEVNGRATICGVVISKLELL